MNLNKINLLIEFLEGNPSEDEIEKYYLDKISIFTKDSINDILINHVYELNLNSNYDQIPRILKLIKY
tara:strand:+ start:1696 stop:1899 length:204 start_codon:yes stop_codon:yes gene_type:complete